MFELYAYEPDGFDSYDWMLYAIGTYRECIAAAQRLLDDGAGIELRVAERRLPAVGYGPHLPEYGPHPSIDDLLPTF